MYSQTHNTTVRHVANTFLHLSFQEHIYITPLQLQLMLYKTYQAYLKLTNRVLFTEPFVACEQGPVLMDIYYATTYETKHNLPISHYFATLGPNIELLQLKPFQRLSCCMMEIWNDCKSANPIFLLQELTNNQSPWAMTRNQNLRFIDPNLIKNS